MGDFDFDFDALEAQEARLCEKDCPTGIETTQCSEPRGTAPTTPPAGSQESKVPRQGVKSWARLRSAVGTELERRKDLQRQPTFGNLPQPLPRMLEVAGLSHPEAAEARNAMFNHVYDDADAGEHVGLGAVQFFQHIRFRTDGGLGRKNLRDVLFSSWKVGVFLFLCARASFNLFTIWFNLLNVLHLRHKGVEPERVLFSSHHESLLSLSICTIEAAAVTLMVGGSLYYRHKAKKSHFQRVQDGQDERGHYGEWRGYAVAMWDILPGICTFSTLKILELVTPEKLSQDFERMVFVRSRRQRIPSCTARKSGVLAAGAAAAAAVPLIEPRISKSDTLARQTTGAHTSVSTLLATGRDGVVDLLWLLIQLLLWKLCPAVIGFLAFVGKLSVTLTQIKIMDTADRSEFYRAILKTAFLGGLMNQLMFVVDSNKLMRRATSRFMFAGEDGKMQREEWDREEVFMACLFRRIFNEFPEEPCKRMVAILTFSTADFQRIVLEEDPNMKVSPEMIQFAINFGNPRARGFSNSWLSNTGLSSTGPSSSTEPSGHAIRRSSTEPSGHAISKDVSLESSVPASGTGRHETFCDILAATPPKVAEERRVQVFENQSAEQQTHSGADLKTVLTTVFADKVDRIPDIMAKCTEHGLTIDVMRTLSLAEFKNNYGIAMGNAIRIRTFLETEGKRG